MSRRDDRARALRILVDEARGAPVPEIDWEAMESRLMQRVALLEREQAARPPQEGAAELEAAPQPAGARRPATTQWMAFAAVAAGLVLGLRVAGEQPAAPASQPEGRAVDVSSLAAASGPDGARGARSVGALQVGDAIEATAGAVDFVAPGSLRFRLSAGGRAVVRRVGDEHVVALERGAIWAEVTPREASDRLVEAFAVEVSGTRVAVHGTELTVERRPDGVVVDVAHGTVAVGPVGYRGPTVGRVLVGPSRASFSLDGGRSARFLAREPVALASLGAARVRDVPSAASPERLSAPAREGEGAVAAQPSRALPARPAGSEGAASASSASGRLAAAPAEAGVVLAPVPAAPPKAAPAAPDRGASPGPVSVAAVRTTLARCFERTYGGGSDSVRLTVSSTLRLTLRADGSVQAARFEPPLEPAFQACASSLLSERLDTDRRDVSIPFTLGDR